MKFVEQTREEKFDTFMKLSKKELAEMLINNLEVLKMVLPITVHPTYTNDFCQHEMRYVQDTSGSYYKCIKCGHTTYSTQFVYSSPSAKYY